MARAQRELEGASATQNPYCHLPTAYCLLSPQQRRRISMAKGQMKSNKEKRKPKKDKDDKKGAKK